MNSAKHIAIICNPKSGKGRPLKLLPLFENYLKQQQFNFTSFTSSLPQNLNQFTDLVIMGGDGTINFTLNHFKIITIPIGIIPCGTGNDIANLLLPNSSLQQQFEMAVFATPQKTDAGKCNNKLFLNGVGIGFDGWVVQRLLAKKLFTGKAANYSTVISLLLFYKETSVTILVDGHTMLCDVFMISAANGKTYGGGFNIAPMANTNDGLLEFICISKLSLYKRLRYLPVLEKGNHINQNLPFVTYQTAKKITVKSTKKLKAHLDGEYLESDRFDIEILPQYLSIRSNIYESN